QVGCEFQPYVLGVMANQKLRIKNSDPILHNVHARPLASGNKEFNFPELTGKSMTLSFPSQEIPVRISCDVHPWMFAYVAVLEHPFFAVTDQDGNFAITNAPSGDYVLEAYHIKTHGNHTGETQKILVTEGQTTSANFTIELPAQVSSNR
ncbi:MAG TPA: carboxypeptidase regulatory-like domain-containing protein, partial [Verrucomicrobiae bacterium]|nr:carboxypeptidase regulatory-like domain-containing protein [Verrucomicrobiae bacterium]